MTLELVAMILIVAACSGGQKGPGRDAWKTARATAETHLRASYGEPPAWRIVEERQGAPFLFEVRSPQEFAVLVHNEQVFTRKGLGALDVYLRESRCIEQRIANIKDMLTLLRLLEAMPPEETRRAISSTAEIEAHRPRLDFQDGGRGTVHLFFLAPTSEGDDSEPDDDAQHVMTEWVLTMNPGQMPVWTKHTRLWNPARKAFDVHHTN